MKINCVNNDNVKYENWQMFPITESPINNLPRGDERMKSRTVYIIGLTIFTHLSQMEREQHLNLFVKHRGLNQRGH